MIKDIFCVFLFLVFMASAVLLIDCVADNKGSRSFIMDYIGLNEGARGCQ